MLLMHIYIFYFSYDTVDRIILENQSRRIKGITVDFEKARTGKYRNNFKRSA